MTNYHGKARNALARRTMEKQGPHAYMWAIAAWLAVGAIAALALIFR